MANSFVASATIQLKRDTTVILAPAIATQTITITGNGAFQQTLTIGTTDETITLTDIATIGWIWIKNWDPTNYVEIGSDGTLYPLKVKALEWAGPFRWNAAALHLKANTGACLVQLVVTPD